MLSEGNWSPIQYFYRSMSMEEILLYFLASAFCLTTPLRDGMNLVAKGYCASRLNNDGVLILSEFTGAAYELEDAIQVNPSDIEAVAEAIHKALQLDAQEKFSKMLKLRHAISGNDIHSWVQSFLTRFKQAAQHNA